MDGGASNLMEMKEIDLEAAPVQEKKIEDAKPDVFIMKTVKVLNRPTFTYNRPAQNNNKSDTSPFHEAEYNFVDIGLAEDTDSILYQANFKRLALGIKAGWAFASRDQKNLDYIKRRISEIEVAQNQTFWALVVEILSNLFRYHNCFLIKSRDKESSSGKTRQTSKGELLPVAGYFVASPETMRFKVGKNYNIAAYKHNMPDGRFKIFAPEDVIHFHIYRKTHHMTGTPSWIPVLDDIAALRRIEEHVENLVYQHIYPLFQYKIGTEDKPMKKFEDGLTEIDIVKRKIQDMPSDGMIFTPERHEITGLSSQVRTIRAEGFLQHFKSRVIAGTGMSQLDFGDGDTSNRSTADSMSKLATDNVKFYQMNLADTVNFELVRELMAEATFQYDHSDEEKKVELVFNEIDLESQIKMQNHYMLLYQGNVHSEGETRKHMGKDPFSEENREDLHLNRVDKLKAEWQAEADVNKVKAQAQNRQQPANQHGKKSGPSGRKSSVEKDNAMQPYRQLAEDLQSLKGRANINASYVGSIFVSTSERIKKNFESQILSSVFQGARNYPITPVLRIQMDVITRVTKEEAAQDIDRLMRQASVQTISELLSREEKDDLMIDKLEFRLRFIENTLTHKAYLLTKIAAMKSAGVKSARIVANPDSERHGNLNGLVIELNTLNPMDLPILSSVNCECDIEEATNGNYTSL